MKKSTGLGRGLSSFFDQPAGAAPLPVTAEPAAIAPESGRTVALSSLDPNPRQPRRHFDEAALSDLAASIAAKGIVQPILVRPSPRDANRFEIVAGERRWRAAQRVPLHDVPVVVKALDDAEVFEIALIENIQRQDLNPIEEAEGYRRLIDEFGHTQDALAQLLGKSRSHVANLLRLLDLPETVRAHVVEGRLTMGHARALITAADPTALAARVIAEELSVRQTEALAQAARHQTGRVDRRGKDRERPAGDPDAAALARDLSAALGMPVELRGQGSSGSLRISYRSLDELDELCRRLTSPRSGF